MVFLIEEYPKDYHSPVLEYNYYEVSDPMGKEIMLAQLMHGHLRLAIFHIPQNVLYKLQAL